ncbi:unnamed protein product [Bursaphelenchus xylophilus]|uniref:(pine wood nematode) hypothetical protein n=1 Tax=Bursaphelenchus xylophilus TaxID=6326 RepID=A0A1I7RRD4_BURXY|nr:unnamed protein product [Bursaphelenchus xylophilus]CAG9130957.1 unnamed protein product [Bursaphelenchus xylophilus]
MCITICAKICQSDATWWMSMRRQHKGCYPIAEDIAHATICILHFVFCYPTHILLIITAIRNDEKWILTFPIAALLSYVISLVGFWRRIKLLLIPNIVLDPVVVIFYLYLTRTLLKQADPRNGALDLIDDRIFDGLDRWRVSELCIAMSLSSPSQLLFEFCLIRGLMGIDLLYWTRSK